jgi:hypothetical protein
MSIHPQGGAMPRTWLIFILPLLTLPESALATGFQWGIEAGGNYSMLDRRSATMPNEQFDPRLLPSLSLFASRRLSPDWSLHPSLRYVQQGMKSAWEYQGFTGGDDETRDHTLSGGMALERRLASSFFVSISPELTYLLAGSLSRSIWLADQFTKTRSYTVSDRAYANTSDRWNATIRAGIGTRWEMAGGSGMVSLRYVREINDMTRIAYPAVFPDQRNIAWTASGTPPDVSEWRVEGVELVGGFEW